MKTNRGHHIIMIFRQQEEEVIITNKEAPLERRMDIEIAVAQIKIGLFCKYIQLVQKILKFIS